MGRASRSCTYYGGRHAITAADRGRQSNVICTTTTLVLNSGIAAAHGLMDFVHVRVQPPHFAVQPLDLEPGAAGEHQARARASLVVATCQLKCSSKCFAHLCNHVSTLHADVHSTSRCQLHGDVRSQPRAVRCSRANAAVPWRPTAVLPWHKLLTTLPRPSQQ